MIIIDSEKLSELAFKISTSLQNVATAFANASKGLITFGVDFAKIRKPNSYERMMARIRQNKKVKTKRRKR